MKKYLLACIITFTMLLIVGCGKERMNLQYEDDYENDIFIGKETFLFTGESDHVYFTTGKAYYGEDELGLLISNFKVKDNIKEGATFSGVNVYFNDKMFAGDVNDEYGTLTKERVESISLGELGAYPEYDNNGEVIGESDSFVETNMNDFKKALKMTIKYCYNNKCELEEFDITYHN